MAIWQSSKKEIDMQYSDELIKQELTRYNTSNTPGPVEDSEIERWKETFVDLDNEKMIAALEYIHGRSWYWNKLMASIDMPSFSTVDEVITQIEPIKVFHPEFEIGIQIAMRMLGKPIEEKIEESESEDTKIKYSENQEPIDVKPIKKGKPKKKI